MKRNYGWLLKWLLAAILLAIGITMFFSRELVFFVTGVALVIFSVFRVYFLLKTLKKESLRTLNLAEVILGTILGGVMIYIGLDAINSGLSPDSIWSDVYKYGLVLVLAVRAIVFLYSVVFLGEKTEQLKFWFHLALLSIASMIVIIEDFNETWVASLLLVIAILGAAYLVFDGTKGYKLYREYSLSLNEEKEKKEEKGKEVEKELPTHDKPQIEKDDDRPYIN